jgi:hypothetical protein
MLLGPFALAVNAAPGKDELKSSDRISLRAGCKGVDVLSDSK